MAEENEPKPITDDPDEQELLKSMNIPLTDPEAKKEEDPDPAEKAPVAAAETEEPAETPETPAAEATPEETPAEPVAATPETPATPPATTEPPKPPTAAKPEPDEIDKEIAAIEAKISAEDFDPYSAEGKKAQIQHNRLCAKAEVRDQAHRQAEVESAFEVVSTEYKVEPARAKTLWKEEWTKAAAKYGETEAANAVATEKWLDRLAAIKNGTKGPEAKEQKGEIKPKPVPPTPITAAGAKVTPPARANVPPAPRARTDEEELVDYQRKHVPGGIKTLAR